MMTLEEAINRIEDHMAVHRIGEYPHIKLKEALELAIDALRHQMWEEQLWHDAKTDPPKTPGLYYGKKDDTNSMYACQYRDGIWMLDMYPQQKMEIVQWADYTAFARENEETVLRPVSRERVEQMRSRWVPLNNTQEHFCESCGVAFNLYAYCKNDYQFCPACGAPMTDEAVEMVMERMKELK